MQQQQLKQLSRLLTALLLRVSMQTAYQHQVLEAVLRLSLLLATKLTDSADFVAPVVNFMVAKEAAVGAGISDRRYWSSNRLLDRYTVDPQQSFRIGS
jgi:hypothetical protein